VSADAIIDSTISAPANQSHYHTQTRRRGRGHRRRAFGVGALLGLCALGIDQAEDRPERRDERRVQRIPRVQLAQQLL